jgi:hypothetical protein
LKNQEQEKISDRIRTHLVIFKTGGWHLAVTLMGSTPIRFRQFLLGVVRC